MSSPRVRARMELIKPKKQKKEKKPKTEDDKKAQYLYLDSKLLAHGLRTQDGKQIQCIP